MLKVFERHTVKLDTEKPILLETTAFENGFIRKCLDYHGLVKIGHSMESSVKVTLENVKKSLKILQKRHPMLRCKPVPVEGTNDNPNPNPNQRNPNPNPSYDNPNQRNPNPNINPARNFHILHDWNVTIQVEEFGVGTFSTVWSSVQRDTEPFKHAMMHLYMFDNPETKSKCLFLTYNHAVCDGVSGYENGLELARCLCMSDAEKDAALLEPPNLYFPPAPEFLINQATSWSFRFNQILAVGRVVKHALFTSALTVPPSRPMSAFDLAKTGHTYTHVIDVGQKETRLILSKAREYKSSLTAAIVAANEDAIRQLLGSTSDPNAFTNVIHTIPMDLRSFTTIPKGALSSMVSFTTFASNAKSPVGGLSGHDLWRLSQKVTAQLKASIKTKSPLGVYFLGGRAANSLPSSDPNDHSTFFSVSNASNYRGKNDVKHVISSCHVGHTRNPSILFLTQPDGSLSVIIHFPSQGVDRDLIKRYEALLEGSLSKLYEMKTLAKL